MPSSKPAKPAGRSTKDKEILSAKHDELLMWTADHLKMLTAYLFPMERAVYIERLSQSKLEKGEYLQRIFAKLRQVLEDPELGFEMPTDLRRSVSDVLRREKPLLKSLSAIQLEDGDLFKSPQKFSLMHPVEEVAVDRYNYPKRTPAGFVDIQAMVYIPNEFFVETSHYSLLDFSKKITEKSLRELVQKLNSVELHLTPYGDSIEIWFAVRTDNFTLGQILQDLKRLKMLENKQQMVVLVVNEISEAMSQLIAHEGFSVLARNSHNFSRLAHH